MKERGFQVYGISSSGEYLPKIIKRENIPIYGVDMPRKISPFTDLKTLFKIYKLVRQINPDIVHTHTPKGGLLGVLAAKMAQVPVIIFCMRGLRSVTFKGYKRKLLELSEKVTCTLADRIISVSFGMRDLAVDTQLCRADKIRVLASGSGQGVDAINRFNPKNFPTHHRRDMRLNCHIPEDAMVLGYVGRIVRDKGIIELAEAWQTLRLEFPSLYLLLVGFEEPEDPVPAEVMHNLRTDTRVIFAGGVSNVAPFYTIMDILILPTHREGFPNTPLEAAAMEVPVISTKIEGCKEAVADGDTGLLVPSKNSQELVKAARYLLSQPEVRKRMGESGRERALRDFRPEKIIEEIYENYLDLLNQLK